MLPFTEPNYKLAFKPHLFFNDLENLTEHSTNNLRTAYGRAIDRGWIKLIDNKVQLSLEARQSIQPFIARKLKGAKLMVIFDIPEESAYIRQKFRGVLKHFEFQQIQQSVWMTDRDHKEIIIETIDSFGLNSYVELYESIRIKN